MIQDEGGGVYDDDHNASPYIDTCIAYLNSESSKKGHILVRGSMTRMRSQSTSGLSASGCLLLRLSTVFVIAPPKMVMLDSGIACFGSNPSTRIYRGTRMPPPPIPPAAAIISPMHARPTAATSHPSMGCSGLCQKWPLWWWWPPCSSLPAAAAASKITSCSSSVKYG